MKIRPLLPEGHHKVQALLNSAFPSGNYEKKLFENIHKNKKPTYEWVCIHRNRFIAYISYTLVFNNSQPCGLHLAPVAVAPEWQDKGVRSELITFSLRQPEIKEKTIFVRGEPKYYKIFGFTSCRFPICPFDKKNARFLSIRNNEEDQFTIRYEPEFSR